MPGGLLSPPPPAEEQAGAMGCRPVGARAVAHSAQGPGFWYLVRRKAASCLPLPKPLAARIRKAHHLTYFSFCSKLRWAEVMGWLDGRGGWSNRGGMLMAVLDLVYRTTKRRV
jgi:hypothetical protein